MGLYHHEIREDIDERVANPLVRRLVRQWQDLADGGDRLPALSEFSGEALAWCADSVMVLRQLDDGDFLYEHYGTAIADASGFDMRGKRVSDFQGPVGAFFRQKYADCLDCRQPIYTIHRADLSPMVQSWERVLLPLCDADGRHYLLVSNQPSEFKHELCDSIMRTSRDGILHLQAERGAEGHIVDFAIVIANPAAERIAGLTDGALIDRRLSALTGSNVVRALAALGRQVMESGKAYSVELHDVAAAALTVYMASGVRTRDGVTVTLTDISSLKQTELELRQTMQRLEHEIAERQALQEELTQLATTDPLTGLWNRREIMARAAQELAASRRYGRRMSLLMLDIDFFKSVNDRYGHATGDRALRMIADICCHAVRETDMVARIGGEEFVVLMPETGGIQAANTAERLRSTIAETSFTDGARAFNLTASLGVAEWLTTETTIEATMHRADIALYRAKSAGRNRVHVADCAAVDMPGPTTESARHSAAISAVREPARL